jgi:hypothetical protein
MPPVSSVKKREGRRVHAAAHLAVVGCHVTIAPASCVKKRKRGGALCCSPGIVCRRRVLLWRSSDVGCHVAVGDMALLLM